MSRILIALGGNALGNDYITQQELIKNASSNLVSYFRENEVVLTHGDGPQVGMIKRAMDSINEDMPLDCCNAMAVGYIGFHLQRKTKQTLIENNIDKDSVALLTEIVVDENDESFKNPTKPIGKFYSKEEADLLMKETGEVYIEDSGRGYRKVVASPKPLKILNINVINALLKQNSIVIAGGGGGIPVVKNYDNVKVEAIIDKDLSSSLLATNINADKFIILTEVDQVKINFGKENETSLGRITVSQAEQYLLEGHFKSGSMLPKIEAAIEFVKNTGNEAIITSLKNISGIKEEKNITIICK